VVSISQKQLIAALVGVCILSAAIGSGITVLAKTGPSGPAGEQGPRGPAGPEGPEGESAGAELGAVEGEVEELREQVEAGEGAGVEGRLEELESEVSELGGATSEICAELEVFC
jgi:hypothetical protein